MAITRKAISLCISLAIFVAAMAATVAHATTVRDATFAALGAASDTVIIGRVGRSEVSGFAAYDPVPFRDETLAAPQARLGSGDPTEVAPSPVAVGEITTLAQREPSVPVPSGTRRRRERS